MINNQREEHSNPENCFSGITTFCCIAEIKETELAAFINFNYSLAFTVIERIFQKLPSLTRVASNGAELPSL